MKGRRNTGKEVKRGMEGNEIRKEMWKKTRRQETEENTFGESSERRIGLVRQPARKIS